TLTTWLYLKAGLARCFDSKAWRMAVFRRGDVWADSNAPAGVCRRLGYNRRVLQRVFRMRTIVYPGTFNPITNGHTDLVERVARIFDHVIVGVGTNTQKANRMALDQRVELCRSVLAHIPNVEVCGFT